MGSSSPSRREPSGTHHNDDDLLVVKSSSTPARSSTSTSLPMQLKVNQKFARVYEERKRKEELAALEKRGFNTEDDESSSETEDEDGEELTKELDADIHKTLQLIRKKDPAIYDSSIAFFKKVEPASDSDDDEKQTRKFQKSSSTPLYYKDLVRQQAIAGDVSGSEEEEEDAPVRTYQEEQDQVKEDLLAVLAENEHEDEGHGEGLFTVRKKREGEERQEEEEALAFASKHSTKLKQDEMDPDKFLEHYLSGEGWKDKTVHVPHYDDIVKEDEEDAEALEKAEDFEHAYNFRFEEQGSRVIQTHARRIEDTMRREDDSRKRKRAERKERKALERQKKEEELRRLKNLKQREVERKLKRVARLMGEAHGTAGLKPEDLEGDFDPEEYDKRMQTVFDDQYYDEDDEMDDKATWDEQEDKELFGAFPVDTDEEMEKRGEEVQEVDDDEEAREGEATTKHLTVEEMEREKQKYLDELYGLDYEDLIGDMKCRFKYRRVATNDFGLTVDEIMAADDKELKQLVSLKRMAPYADTEYNVDRKRLKSLKKSIRQVQQENRRRKKKPKLGEGVEAQESTVSKKKRKRNKSKTAEREENEAGPTVVASDVKQTSENTKEEVAKEKVGNEPSKRKRRSKKKSGEKNMYAHTGLPPSRLESYKLLKARKGAHGSS